MTVLILAIAALLVAVAAMVVTTADLWRGRPARRAPDPAERDVS